MYTTIFSKNTKIRQNWLLFFAKTIKITDFIANDKVITNHQVLEDFLNAALEGEMQSLLEATKPESGNRRNGKMRKQLQTEYGPVEIGTPPSYILDIVPCFESW